MNIRNMRGTRRFSMRARLAVAAAVLAGGGGAAGVVAVTASHGVTATQSAGFATSYHQPITPTKALSSAMNGWWKSPGRSLDTLSRMTPISSFAQMHFHHATLVVQRGTVVATAQTEFVTKSANGKLQLWHVTPGKTQFLNVGGNKTGMAAMTGGTMMTKGHMNPSVRVLKPGDPVFVFGEKENHTFKAQLILFAVPMKAKPVAPKMTTSPSMTATPSMAPTPAMTPPAPSMPAAPTMPAMPATPAPTGSAPTFSGTHS